MGLFDRFKRKPASPEPIQQKHSQAYIDVLSQSVGTARLRQLAFGREIQGLGDWNIDFSSGIITFGPQSFPIQFLGSESDKNGTWMWGTNNINHFPPQILEDVHRFYTSPLAEKVPELQSTTAPLDDLVNGHSISSIVSANHPELVCYYRCPYDGGAAFVLVKNLPDSVFEPPAPETLPRVISELISVMPLNHCLLAEGMLDTYCINVEKTAHTITGWLPAGPPLQIEFDDLGRIAKMNFSSALA